MSIPSCCVTGFEWNGTPQGRIDKILNQDVYIAGNNSDKAVMIICDLLGWTYANNRLLADHCATEAGVTVYVPDFYNGEIMPSEPIDKGRFDEVDIPGFLARNSREIREPAIFETARELRQKHKKLGIVGFCYGGWAAFRLGSEEHQTPLVDCIVVGHPSLLTVEDIDGVNVPVQMLAPEIDWSFSSELKLHTFQKLQSAGIPFDYQHFPKLAHGCLVRGDPEVEGEREGMVRGKDAAVSWLKYHLSQ